ncbi:MAG: hypothetical protein ACUVSL_17465, partial [Chloroflexus sp.]
RPKGRRLAAGSPRSGHAIYALERSIVVPKRRYHVGARDAGPLTTWTGSRQRKPSVTGGSRLYG